jgi:hypothetical protein
MQQKSAKNDKMFKPQRNRLIATKRYSETLPTDVEQQMLKTAGPSKPTRYITFRNIFYTS